MPNTEKPNWQGDKYRDIYTAAEFKKLAANNKLTDKQKERAIAVMVHGETPWSLAEKEGVNHQAIYNTLQRVADKFKLSGWTRVFYDVPEDKVNEFNAIYADFIANADIE